MHNEEELTHIDLFSGIGGFTLAGEWAGFKTVVFCEKEAFCQKVLKKHWPETPIISEIRNLDGTKYKGATILTGGFPCQPFSVAGKQRGKADDRYLWPEMRRVINEAKPHWILAENVPGIYRMELDTVLANLEGTGYATGTFIIPACGLNAPHRRNRIWIVAHNKNVGLQGQWPKGEQEPEIYGKKGVFMRGNSHAPDPEAGVIRRVQNEGKKKGPQGGDELLGNSHRLSWQRDWYEIATRFCRVDDGVSNRVYRLKALGNAIVPQVAYEILKNIAYIEKASKK